MLANELLETKDRTQRALARQGNADLHEYAQNIHRIVRDIERQYGLTFRYQRAAQKLAPLPEENAPR